MRSKSLPNRRRSNQQILLSILALILFAIFYFLNANKDHSDSFVLTPPPDASSTPLVDLSTGDQPTVTLPAAEGNPVFPVSSAADFDYYVLSLSWSPQYCATDGSNDTQQCSLGRKLGFVLHGLWPQYETGYPSNCTAESFPSALKKEFQGLYPSDALYTHEWEKHGTCSGLAPAEFLAASKQLRDAVTIPAAYQSPAQSFRVTVAQLKADFLADNPSLGDNGLVVLCSDSGRFLSELRVCFTVEGQPRACSAEVLKIASKSCGQADFLVRNVK